MSGGSSQKQTQQSTSSNTIDPAQLALLQGNYAGAQTRASTLTPYTGQLTAGFTPTQTQAQGILSGVATDPTYAANNNSAVNSVQGILGNPANTTVTPQTLAGTDLSPYLNPYTNDVINNSISQNERARQIANVNDNQKATAAGAFGGDRSAVLNAQTNDAYDRNNQTNIAALNQANYQQAQAGATTDINNNLNAQQSTINDTLAGRTQQLGAAGDLVAANNNGLNLATQQGGILGAVGDAQQQQQQTELTNAYQAYMAGQQLTVTQQQLLNSALGLIPNQQTVNSSGSGTSQTTTNPGIAGILGGLGSLAQGAAMFA